MSNRESNDAHIKQKRARSQLSCTACRSGKLRCNRGSPCDQCMKRSKEAACTYLPPATKSRSAQNVKGLIKHIEQLVVDLMNSRSADNSNTTGSNNARTGSIDSSLKESPSSQTESSQTSNRDGQRAERLPPQVTPPYSEDNSPAVQNQHDAADLGSFGHLRISKSETSYVGSSHWATILDSISELKRELVASGDEGSDDEFDAWQTEEPLDIRESGLPGLLRSPRRVTKAELLSALPPKAEADALVSLWFNSPHPWKMIVHAPQFQNEYRQFWRAPTKAPVMWLGLLYAILSTASSFRLRSFKDSRNPEAQNTLQQTDLYYELSASAAVLGNYMKPKVYTLECLLIQAGGARTQNFFDIWVLMGVVLRLAMRMGYHRDPSHYSNVSALHGEMRRRVWHMLYMMDVLVSFQLGLPAMLRTVQSDTKAPHNLFDQDFSIHSKTLPPSRPVEEITPSSYGAAKVRICQIFALAADISHATTPPSYEEVMDLDARLENARASIPPALRFESLGLCITDNPESLMCKFNLELLYLKTKTVLHRRFMVSTPSQPAEPYSRKCCISSAMRTLQHHQSIYAASCPGGQLETVSYYMCSIGTHDFLLASMIICLELARQLDHSVEPESDEIATREDMIAALEASKRVWEQVSAETGDCLEPSLGSGGYAENAALEDVKTACKAMAVMLQKVKAEPAPPVAFIPFQAIPSSTSEWPDMSLPTTISPTTTATMSTNQNWQGLQTWPTAQNDFSTLGDMIDVSNDINWVSLINYFS